MSVVEVVKYEKPNKQFEQNFKMKFEISFPNGTNVKQNQYLQINYTLWI